MAQYKSDYTGAQIDAGIGKANTAVQPADLNDYQTKIDSSHKLSADLISDGSTNKTVTETEKTTWNGKSVVSGTNDGTNWSTITINGTTKNIPVGGGGSSVTVKEINFMDSDEWDIEENQPTQTVMADILANHYTFIRLYGIPVDEGIEAETWLVANMSADIEESTGARYYYKFDEGDEDEGTSPNIEQYLFVYEDHEGGTYQMLVDQFYLGTKIDSSNLLSADLVDDSSATNKFVTASDKTTWSGKSVVSGTNDGTNWSTITIDGTTKAIPAGGSTGLKEVYVNNSTGSDSNAGTSWSAPKKTFAAALAAADDECTLYFEGDTQERLNIKTNANQKVLRIIGRDGKRNRILCGTKLVNFQTTSTTGVYKIETPSETAFSSNYYSVVQDNVIDTSTEITSYEAHPAQKGRRYRMLSTAIPRKTSIANVISSTVGFYHDGTNLYVKPASTDFTNHPIYCPTENGGIYGNDGSCLVEISNVEVWHAPLLITNCPNAKLTDCTCTFALGTGGIKYDDSVGVTLTRCEAAYVLNTSGYGDGINAHSSKYESASGDNSQSIKYVSAELIDCWCHDNSDDGWSDHSGCEVVIRGGLYEYNHKGGVTPSNGGKCTCYDVMTRKNCRGFYYVSAGSQKEKVSYFYCENCVSDGEDATRVSQGITRFAGAGFSADDIGVSLSGWQGIKAKFVNCKSMNNAIGFGAGKKSTVTLIDCSTNSVTTRMSTLDSGEITPLTTTNISPGTNVTGVTLSQSSKALDYTQSFTLTASIEPSNATNKNVVWDVPLGDTYIQIASNGLSCTVTALSTNGTATVRVTTEDGSFTATCSVTVAHKELVSLTKTGTLTKTSYEAGETLDLTGLTYTATFDDTSTQQLTQSDLVITPTPLTEGTTSATVSYTYGSVTKTDTITGLTVTGFLSASDFAYGAVKNDGSVDTTTPQVLNNIYQKNIKQFSNYTITPLTDNVIWKVVYYDANGGYISNSGWMCRVQNQYASIASDYDITPAAYARICIANDVQVSPGTYTVAQMFERISVTENN